MTSLLGGGKYLWQMHSNGDDRVHSATVKDASTFQDLGCIVYREDTRQHRFYTPRGDYDEVPDRQSGRWLVIKENVDNQYMRTTASSTLKPAPSRCCATKARRTPTWATATSSAKTTSGAAIRTVRVWQFSSNMNATSGLVRLCASVLGRSGPRTPRAQQLEARRGDQSADGVQQQRRKLEPVADE